MSPPTPYRIKYEFELSSGRKQTYEIRLDRETISLSPQKTENLPPWTKLEVGQCKNCPLKPETTPYCPIAVNLSDLVEHFKDETSHAVAKVTVTTEERIYFQETSVQKGLFSIFGIIMATSGCPVMNFLKPMARFHLPFSTLDESIIRSVSMYLLRQYYEIKRGRMADLELKGLDEKYAMIQKVNRGMNSRIKTVLNSGDANQNTMVTLDCISKMLSMALSKNLEKFEYLFTNSET